MPEGGGTIRRSHAFRRSAVWAATAVGKHCSLARNRRRGRGGTRWRAGSASLPRRSQRYPRTTWPGYVLPWC